MTAAVRPSEAVSSSFCPSRTDGARRGREASAEAPIRRVPASRRRRGESWAEPERVPGGWLVRCGCCGGRFTTADRRRWYCDRACRLAVKRARNLDAVRTYRAKTSKPVTVAPYGGNGLIHLFGDSAGTPVGTERLDGDGGMDLRPVELLAA